MAIDASDRHPAVQDLVRFFDYEHLPEHLQAVSKVVHDAAGLLVKMLPDCPQLSHGLHELLRAKDAFVRAALPAPAATAPGH